VRLDTLGLFPKIGAFTILMLASCGGGGDASPSVSSPSPPPPGSTAFGPPWITAQTSTGVAWTACVDYEVGRDGSGCFIQFLSNNKANTQVSAVTFNGGCWDCTPGREQGDLDVAVLVDGQPGYIYAFTNVGLAPSHDGWPSIGQNGNRFKEIWVTTVPCPSSAPVRECISVNGGFVPIYR
jgi:hypothetical protein